MAAIETMGNRARTEILRILLTEGAMTRTQIATRLAAEGADVPLRMVLRHLNAMEEQGLVVCDVPREVRHGRTPAWSANPDRPQQLAEQWLGYLRSAREADSSSPE